jgi:hypothetical protein
MRSIAVCTINKFEQYRNYAHWLTSSSYFQIQMKNRTYRNNTIIIYMVMVPHIFAWEERDMLDNMICWCSDGGLTMHK